MAELEGTMQAGSRPPHPVARAITAAEFRARWLHESFARVFVPVGEFAGEPARWTEMVFQPGYTFTFLDKRSNPFPKREDYDRLCRFARAVGDDFMLTHGVTSGWEDDGVYGPKGSGSPEREVAYIFSTHASWEEMKAAVRESPSTPYWSVLSLGPRVSDFNIWSPRALWGLQHSDDGEVAIVGTWGPEITLAFREAFEVEGDGITANLKESYGDYLNPYRRP